MTGRLNQKSSEMFNTVSDEHDEDLSFKTKAFFQLLVTPRQKSRMLRLQILLTRRSISEFTDIQQDMKSSSLKSEISYYTNISIFAMYFFTQTCLVSYVNLGATSCSALACDKLFS